jgi:transcriptional regulator with XRE-family HTH domain
MFATQDHANALEARRRELKMSRASLARRSGVSMPTVFRLLSAPAGLENASLRCVLAIAKALDMVIRFDPEDPVDPLRFRPKVPVDVVMEREAKRKAERLVAMVQATSGLEGQAVPQATVRSMVRKTTCELLAGSARRIWSD